MELEFNYWQDGTNFVGYLKEYPENSTRGLSLPELEKTLMAVYKMRQEEKKHIAEINKIGRVRMSAYA